uniref:Uncharacterized protein n=4 Tax=Cercopithecinae TaxID=9528 RepID=A0A2K5KVS1_CERAT|nr:unnamed protein product [Macaca fascicularis]
MRIAMTSIFHQPGFRMYVMCYQNSIFITLLHQETHPVKNVNSLDVICLSFSLFRVLLTFYSLTYCAYRKDTAFYRGVCTERTLINIVW